jgi:hypothetical protein
MATVVSAKSVNDWGKRQRGPAVVRAQQPMTINPPYAI